MVEAKSGQDFGLVVALLKDCGDSVARVHKVELGTYGRGVRTGGLWALPSRSLVPVSPSAEKVELGRGLTEKAVHRPTDADTDCRGAPSRTV